MRYWSRGAAILAVVVLACTSPVVPTGSAGSEGQLEIHIQQESRTILPSYWDKVKIYLVELLNSQGRAVVRREFLAGAVMRITEIPVGNYSILLQGMDNQGDPILQGEESVTVKKGPNTASVSLNGLLTGSGDLELTLLFPPAAGIDSVALSLVPFGETHALEPLAFSLSESLYQSADLASGDYEVLIEFYKEGEVLARIFEIVWIRGNLVTKATINIPIKGFEEPPEAPTDAQAQYLDGQALVTWSDISPVETSYQIEVSVNSDPYSTLASLTYNSEQFIYEDLIPQSTIQFRIRALNDFGPSEWVETNSIQIPRFELPQTASPQISPANGLVLLGNSLTISSVTPGAMIFFTLDDSLPSSDSIAYSEPLLLGEGEYILQAIALAEDHLASDVLRKVIKVQPGYSDGVKVHVMGYTHIWAWDDSLQNYTGGDWPGAEMEAEINGWVGYTIPDVPAINLLFSNDGAGKTRDMSREAGEYWFYEGEWYTQDPYLPLAPKTVGISPEPGLYVEPQVISLQAEKGGDDLFYTLDGSIPDIFSTKYSGPFTLSESAVVTVLAVRAGLQSEVMSFAYTVDADADILPPEITPDLEAQRYVNPVDVSFTVTDNKSDLVVVYYTTDGSAPTTSSPVYLQGIPLGPLTGTALAISSNTTVRFLMVDQAGNQSQKSFYYPIGAIIDPSREDFREETVYFLMTARFYDGDLSNTRPSPSYVDSGNAANNDPSWRGDFKGLIEKLDYIKALGFTAIWITPPVLNRNYYDYHGYHGWDFTRIDGRLESPGATYQDLIDEVHARDMKIIQDIVVNHSGRYGLNDVAEVQYWGDRNDPDWGKDSEINYYDLYNPDFEYDGVSIEPISGKSWYNGDLWSKEFPSYVTWDPVDEYYYWNGDTHSHQNDHNLWGLASPYRSPEGYQVYHFQWPGMYESQFSLLDPQWFHNFWLKNWEDYTSQYGTIHEDCLDLDTESPVVQEYLIDAYNQYIEMGVDGFRIDTVKHVSRNTFNRRFNPAFMEAAAAVGNQDFYMVGEVCVRDHGVWNKGNPALSQPFYTWKERGTFSEDDGEAAFEAYLYETGRGANDQPTSDNHLLRGNEYHQPDYSQFSGMNVIDFRMHWNFASAGAAFGVRDGDQYTNDATWNMTYVESHDYSPMEVGNSLYARMSDENVMAENWSLMFTWRGIPTIFYGNEILFKAGAIIDEGPNRALEDSGRAYFGDHIEGSVQVQDFAQWSHATGEMANTLSHPLALHLQRLNQLRRAIPALQKGQYSTEGVSGNMAFKRRYTNASQGIDSYVLVTVSGGATFTDVLNGTYVDAITGDIQEVTDGTITLDCSGQGNMRVYVLNTPQTPAPGKVGEETNWIY
jgi:glycosidase